ncbi:MAG: transketolase [Omnitrophica WOR_2 bacterium RIFCSPHIGHO2_01_FULL_48_9]|nr:MAG: transketolase [Omnitrophica WOR_2 bacterium RIFCSPHIGHO2_01_FULL_48_9]
MRQASLDVVYELAKKDKRVFFIGSDLGVGVLQKFKDEMPERFLMEGVSEANIVGLAAGLAMEGKIVYINTIATFLTRRCFEQIVLDLCLHNVNVRLLASGGGLVYTPLGPTHEAIDDIAILRAIPNMTIVAPADAEEMRRVMAQTLDYPGPMYIRFAKGGDPIVTREDIPFKIGKALLYREGSDALVITTGITLQNGLEAAERLAQEGLEITVLHVPTVKPLDKESILKAADRVATVVTIEEHTILGGLGGAVAEILAEANFNPGKKFKRIGIPDVFPKKYGSQASLMKEFKITTDHLVDVLKNLVNSEIPVKLSESELVKAASPKYEASLAIKKEKRE